MWCVEQQESFFQFDGDDELRTIKAGHVKFSLKTENTGEFGMKYFLYVSTYRLDAHRILTLQLEISRYQSHIDGYYTQRWTIILYSHSYRIHTG